MVDLETAASLDQLFPKLKIELQLLQVEVVQLMLGKTNDLQKFMDTLGRWIAYRANENGISIFAAATHISEKSTFVEIPLIVAFAAAIEVAASQWDSVDHASKTH